MAAGGRLVSRVRCLDQSPGPGLLRLGGIYEDFTALPEDLLTPTSFLPNSPHL